MKSTVPAPAAALLDFIAKYESRGNYLAYIGHAGSLAPLPATLDGVLAFQTQLVQRGEPSGAVGRYQIIQKTLQSLMTKYNIPGTEAFTSELQDELGYYLLQGRGYTRWIAGTLSNDGFADALSQEWASMPYHTGRSFYDGDRAGNSSLVSRAVFLGALASAKSGAAATQKEVVMTTGATGATGPAKATHVDFIAGITNFVENTISQIESGIKVAVSPTTSAITVTPGTSSVSGVFASISQAQLAISELGKIVADAKAGAWSNEPADVVAFLKTFFSILANFGIVVPGLTTIVEMLPSMEPVTAAS